MIHRGFIGVLLITQVPDLLPAADTAPLIAVELSLDQLGIKKMYGLGVGRHLKVRDVMVRHHYERLMSWACARGRPAGCPSSAVVS